MEEIIEEEFELVPDCIRAISEHLEVDDQISLSEVCQAWRKAVEKNTDSIWEEEWEKLKANYQGASWFTEKVYNINMKKSHLNSLLNHTRKLVGKSEKEHQSFRQKYLSSEEIVEIENPTPLDLLIANGQRRIESMSEQELREILSQRPKMRKFLAKTGCVVATPVLAALGLALLPVSALFLGLVLGYHKISGKSFGRGGGPVGAGIAELLIPTFPTALSWMGAYYALTFAVSEPNLRKIPQLYSDTKKYLEAKNEK